MKVVAHFRDIESVICKYIDYCDSANVCSAWMTSVPILDALSVKDTSLIMTDWNKLNPASSEYDPKLVTLIKKAIPRAYVYERNRLMHNKFTVLLRDDTPYAVITGSYNYTTRANDHRENIVYIDDMQVASQYDLEFHAILSECHRI